jgi:hypothetical protein
MLFMIKMIQYFFLSFFCCQYQLSLLYICLVLAVGQNVLLSEN